MNELIAKLAEEATYEMEFGGDALQTSNGEITYEIPAGFIEAFAKLIVRECAEAALAKGKASPDTDFRTGSYVISEYLLSRYGVE